ncbi:hypothetical protein [Microbacterium sp. SS28]|uniref:hypothetical protein n=1 Tax=Microbacterium sp. SS28 TaxID=2919948 RepID=UPI001FAA26FF|nr:hypothetical protein [Microbacterium sp. SS28]
MSLTIVHAETATPAPLDPASTAANVALSNYYLALTLFIGAIVVIAIALTFAWMYHRAALTTIQKLAKSGKQAVTTSSDDALTEGVDSEPAIVGSSAGTKGEDLMFTVTNLADGEIVTWDVSGATFNEVDGGRTIVAQFASDGNYKVRASITDKADVKRELEPKEVKIGAQATAPAPAIVIPFVVKNWGRLVIVLFGVGVISALMATKILDAAAGVGILGTLLGAGAVASTPGAPSETPAQPQGGGAGGSGAGSGG